MVYFIPYILTIYSMVMINVRKMEHIKSTVT
jgi:hypothetical protein